MDTKKKLTRASQPDLSRLDVQALRQLLDETNAKIALINRGQTQPPRLYVETSELVFFKTPGLRSLRCRAGSPTLSPEKQEARYMARLKRELNPCGSPIQALPKSPEFPKASPKKTNASSPYSPIGPSA